MHFFFYKLTDPGGHDRKRIGFQREKTKEEYEQIKYGWQPRWFLWRTRSLNKLVFSLWGEIIYAFSKIAKEKKNPRFCFNRTTTTVSDENSLKWNSGWLKHALAAAACPISLWFTLKEEHLCCTFPLYPTLALNQFWKVLLAIKEELIGNCFRDFMGK